MAIPAVLVTLALPACGGSDGAGGGDDNTRKRTTATPSARPAPSEAASTWARRADAVCRRHRPGLVPIGRELDAATAAAPPDARRPTKRLVTALGRLDRALNGIFNDLREIQRPEDDKRPDRLIALYGETVFEIHYGVEALGFPDLELADSYFRKAEKRSTEAHEVAQQLGVKQCTPALSER